jgi:hypothetical protein
MEPLFLLAIARFGYHEHLQKDMRFKNAYQKIKKNLSFDICS